MDAAKPGKPFWAFLHVFAVSAACVLSAAAESIEFSGFWSSYIGTADNYVSDAVSGIALGGDGSVYFGGTLGAGRIFKDASTEVPALNVNFNFLSSGFAAKISAGGGADALPQYMVMDNEFAGSEMAQVAVSTGCVAGAGVYQDYEGVKRGAVICYSKALAELWRFALSNVNDSAFSSVAVGSDGSVYAAGTSAASNSLAPGAIVYKLSSAGRPVWSNYLGGTIVCKARACALSKDGAALYVAGTGTNGAGVTQGFLKKLDASTGAAQFAATLAGSVASLAVASDGGIVLGGTSSDGFVAKLTDTGAAFATKWTQVLTGSGTLNALSLDATNRIAVAGTSRTAWFTATDGTAFKGASEGYVAILSTNAQETLFSSWLGGESTNTAESVAFSGDLLTVCGTTFATNWIGGGFCSVNYKNQAKWTPEDVCGAYGYLKTWQGQTFIPNPPGTLTVALDPVDAVAAGAAWSFDGGATWLASGAYTNLAEGTYSVTFKAVDGFTAPSNRAGIVISPSKTNSLSAVYAALTPPFAKRTISGTNVTVTVVIPLTMDQVNVIEKMPGLTATEYASDNYGTSWVARNRILTFNCYADVVYGANTKIILNYTVSGSPGTYAINGTVQGLLYGDIASNSVPVQGASTVTIPDPSAVTVPIPEITAFCRDGAAWALTFVSTQNVAYAILTNGSLSSGFSGAITNVPGANGSTTVRLTPQQNALFFKVKSAQ